MFCSPAVKTVCVGSGQRRCCQVTASSLVTITTTLLASTVKHTDVLGPLGKTTAMARHKAEQHKN